MPSENNTENKSESGVPSVQPRPTYDELRESLMDAMNEHSYGDDVGTHSPGWDAVSKRINAQLNDGVVREAEALQAPAASPTVCAVCHKSYSTLKEYWEHAHVVWPCRKHPTGFDIVCFDCQLISAYVSHVQSVSSPAAPGDRSK